VALALPGTEPLTYSLPESLSELAGLGLRAEVPVGSRMMVGVITGFREKTHRLCRPVSAILDEKPILDQHLLWLTQWVSQRYLCSWGQAIAAALPPGLSRRQSKIVSLAQEEAAVACGDSLELRIIGLLQDRGRVALSWLLGRIGAGGQKALDSLVQRGVVVVGSEWRGGRNRPSTVRFLVPTMKKMEHGLTPARARLWELLGRCGELPSSKVASSSAAWLVNNGYARWEMREENRIPQAVWSGAEQDVHILNEEQEQAFRGISDRMEAGGYGVNLLFGVTASGKTEVYLRAAKKAVEKGRQVLVLVPEIGLIFQMASRLSRHFPGLGIWHSELSEGERYDVWRSCRHGLLPLVVGVRSAVFAPLENLGLVVVDEEHDAAFKQQEAEPLYHAREVALARAEQLGIQAILGSATPSAESYHRARQGDYRMFTLSRRVGDSTVPDLKTVDCRTQKDSSQILSPSLVDALRERISSGEQAMLLLNRRGFATAVQCLRCGAFIRCRNCDINLTYHRTEDQTVCHYCGFRRSLPAACPDCGSEGLRARGGGTQRLELELKRLLPEAGLLRMDSDTTSRKGAHDRILSDFQQGKARVLIGTQMISKGHHFPGVTLVGILDIDRLLGLPDFRSAERAAQLLVQMSGRAGRGRRPGVVMVQTRLPEMAALHVSGLSDYRKMLEFELEQRRAAGYPPYKHIALITVAAGREAEAQKRAEETAAVLRRRHQIVEVLGPAPAPISRLRGRHRWQILLKHEQLAPLLEAGRSAGRGSRDISIRVDVDPAATL
jgi:primosomal protein N' (replication factor Y)